MMKFYFVFLFFLLFPCLYSFAQQNVVPLTSDYTSQLGFVENVGQSGMQGQYLYEWKHNNVYAYFKNDRVVFFTQEVAHIDNKESLEATKRGDNNLALKLSAVTTLSRFDLVFENCNPSADIVGDKRNNVRVDYYLAHCPNGLLDVSSYSNIRYKELWPGIDLVFSFDGVSLKYYFEVRPGFDPQQIKVRWDGVDNLHINAEGEIQFSLGTFEFYDKAPVSFSDSDNQIATTYEVKENSVSFNIAEYDATEKLIIDPGLYWASSLEYNGYGSWGEVVSNSSGQYYYVDWEWNPGGTDVMNYLNSAGTSSTYSSDASNEDIVISRFSKEGSLVWACRYGGTGDDDVNGGVEIDDSDNLYVAGTSAKNTSNPSGDLPLLTLTGAFNQAWDGSLSTGRRGYLLKFSPSNARLWATYLDRGANLEVFDVACGQNNSIFMTGTSGGSPTYISAGSIPTGTGYAGALNGTSTSHSFILKFNSSGAIEWSTWLPGVAASTSTGRCSDIAVNKTNGYFYIAGDEMWSFTTPFNTAIISASYTNQGDNDMFYMAFDANKQPIPAYGKYYGGAGFDKINVGAANGDIELDASGNLYLCGHTYSANFPPVVNPGGCAYFDGTINDGTGIVANKAGTQDGFLYKVNTSGTVTYGTFFGGTAYTSMKKLKKDSHDNLWICGEQTAAGLATVNRTGYYNQAIAGTNLNIMFAQLGVNDDMQWLAYYGFTTGYSGYGGYDIYEPAGDSVYNYLAGNFNYTVNTGGGYQYSVTSSCGGAAQFRNYYTSYAPFTISGTAALCPGGTTTWTATTGGGTWSSSDPSVASINSSSGLVTALTGGTVTISYTLTIASCAYTVDATVTVSALNVSASVTTSPICAGSSTTISASGATTYNWSNSLGTNSSYSVSPATTTTYSVTGSDGTCTNTASVTVTVNSLPTVSAAATVSPICAGSSTTISAGGAATYNWSNSLGTNSSYTVSPSATTTYSVTGTSGGCTNSASVTVTVNPVTDAAMNAAGPFCVSDAAVTLTAVNTGGTWAGTGITNTSTGAFDPGTAGVGTHEITYTTTGTCPDTDTIYITVSSFLDASIDPAGPFCLSGPAVDLTAATSGGTWSGTGITNTANGTFDPSTAGIGTHEIVYTTTGTCGDSDTIQISVTGQLDATIAAAGPFCSNDAAVNLTAANPGGTWSGTGITNVSTGTFDPSVAGTGTHQIIYTISGACGDADSADIVVNDAPEFTYVATEESCTGAEDGSIAITLSSGLNPITYTWNTGASAATVSGIGEGNYLVTVTDANGCERSGTIALGDPGVACDDVTPHAIVPNAFSPNGDGENDVLFVRGEGVSQLTFIVYDRWGEKVFSTTSLDFGWDGTFRGKELDPAVFTYYLHAIFIDGSDKIEKGDITLTR